jgi:hypothetical protein
MQRPQRLATGDGAIGRGRQGAQLIPIGEQHDGVQRGIDSLDAVEVMVEDLDGRQLAGRDRRRKVPGAAPVQVHAAELYWIHSSRGRIHVCLRLSNDRA